MAKQVKAALVAALVIFVVAGAVMTGGWTLALTQGVAGAATLTAAGMAAITFGTTLLTSLIGGMTSKGMDASSGNFGSKFATRSATAPRQIIYGKTRVGGTIVHMETSGVDNYLLHMVIAISGHEIEELTNIRLNDKDLTTSTSTISGSTVYTVTNSDYTNTDNDNNFGSGRLMRYTFSDGSQTAVDAFMNAQLSSMGTSDKFLGMSYIYMQMVFDSEKFGGGIPATSFLVKGKKVYDPRNNSTAWSDNPALIIRDYLTNTEYGLKAQTVEINDTTNAGGFASAANTCDQNVTLADGSTTEKRYTANGFTNFSASGNGIIESILSSMAGKMSYVNGQFNVFAGASQTPSLTITDDELLASLSISTKTTSNDFYNTVKPVYVDSTTDYQGTDAEVYQDTTFLNADTPSGESTANYVKQMEVQLPFTVTDTMAQRLGRIALKSQRQTVSLSALVSLKFMRCQPNDWVYLTNVRLGYSQKVFQVVSTNLEVISEGEVPVIATRLELIEIASSVFNFATNDYTTGQSEGSDVTTGSYAVTAPSNLALAQQTNKEGVTTKVDIKASWTNNSSDKVTLTEVAYKLSTDSAFTSDFTVGKGVAVALLPNVVVGKTYNVKARHIDVNGVTSAYTSVVNIAIAAPTDAPAVPQSLTASSGEPFSILVSWINSTSADLKATKIYRRTSNSTPTDDTYLVDTILGANGKKTTTVFGPQDGLTAGTTYYFWVRSVNQSDVHSAFVGSASGNFTNVSAGEIVDGAITTVKLAADAVTNAKIAVNAIQGDVIAAGAIVEAKLGVDAVTNAKLADNAVNTAQIVSSAISAAKIATGAVTNTKLGTDAVTNAKLADNAVQTAQIAADAITTAKIATGAITSTELGTDAVTNAKLADNAVNTAQIAADAISTAKIADNAVTSAIIANGAITETKITNNAITTDKINANAITTAKITAGAVIASTIATNAITAVKINAGAITTAKINAGAITADTIATNAITAVKIAADAVTADKVAANSIVANSIVTNAITSAKINAGAITTAKINAGAVTADTIASNAITAVKINADAVTADKVAANAIVANNITANAITSEKIIADAITTAKINAGAITADTIATNAITAVKINADAITSDKIAANAITSAKITAGAIVAGKLAADSIVASNIQANAITAAKINADAVTADKVAANAIVAANIVGGTITATQMAADSIGADQIAANAVTADAIAAGTITATEIASNTITSTQINVDTLDVKHFANVSADIINQTGGTVPLRVTAENSQWNGTYPGSTQNNVEAVYMNTTLNNVRNDGGYQVIYSAVLGDTRNGTIEYSFNNSTWTSLGSPMNTQSGTFRSYIFVWQGTISGMSSSQETVYWRVKWNNSGSIFNSTYQAIYIDVDNTQ